MELIKIVIDDNWKEKRLDTYLANSLKDKSRSYIQQLIDDESVLVNYKAKKSSYKLKNGDEIEINIPDPIELDVVPENIPLDILYEDDDVIVVNKPQGMVVHPASGVYSGTLVNALLYHCNDLSGINGVARPGIVHRIDKDTSGVLVVAKNDISHNKLASQLKEHTMNRIYIALVEGVIKEDEGIVDKPLGRHPKDRIKFSVVNNGKNAITHYKVLQRFNKYTLIQCKLETGRTHQIRVHMAHIGHPLVGDPVYGYKKQRFKLHGQMLHAQTLGFIHPTKGEYVEFSAPIPKSFDEVISILKKELNFKE